MITRVNKVGGEWFAYMAERVLGPFPNEGKAWAAVRAEEREARRERDQVRN